MKTITVEKTNDGLVIGFSSYADYKVLGLSLIQKLVSSNCPLQNVEEEDSTIWLEFSNTSKKDVFNIIDFISREVDVYEKNIEDNCFTTFVSAVIEYEL